MSTRTPLPRFGRLAAVNILANVTVPLAGLVDLAMLGRLADVRFLAGVALAGVIFDFVYWNAGFLRMATTGTTAQAVGRDDPAAMFHVLYRSLLVAGLFGVALVALQRPWGELSFWLLAGTPGVESAGRDYFYARVWGAPATMVGLVFLGWFLGRAESRIALLLTAVANGTNILLNYVFIMKLDMAARGAGLATALSQYVLVAVALACYWSRHRRRHGNWRTLLAREPLMALVRLQRDILLRTLCLTTVFALFTNISAALGTVWLAANVLLLRVVTTGSYLVDGAAYATESLAGILYGRGDRGGLTRLLRKALWVGLAFGGLVALSVVVAPRPLIGLLTIHDEVIQAATAVRFWLLPILFFGSLAYIYDGFFIGLTAATTLRNAMLLSLAAFLPLAGAAAALAHVHLLWAALAAFMVSRVVLLGRASRAILARDRVAPEHP